VSADRAVASSVEYRNVGKRYPGQAEPAIEGLSLDVPAGEICVFVGPSGCGKTTALRLANRMIELTEGDILLDGKSVRTRPAAELRRDIGYVIQQIGLFPHLTIGQNIGVVPRLLDWDKRRIAARVEELLELVSLPADMRDRYPAQLSGGQRQRMALARALAVEPSVLLLDEPFGALDANVRADLRAWLRRMHEEVPVTTVLVTHDQEEAMELADRIVLLKDGKIAQVGAPRELYDEPADSFVMGFLGRVSQLDGKLVRPHDVTLSDRPEDGWEEAMVQRVVHLGFEVRVEVVRPDGEEVTAQLTRAEAEALEPHAGSIVYLRPPASGVSV
jgi:sulfate/thiosulfate transport system ATP-binding protein